MTGLWSDPDFPAEYQSLCNTENDQKHGKHYQPIGWQRPKDIPSLTEDCQLFKDSIEPSDIKQG